MVYIPLNYLFNKPFCSRRIIKLLPSCKLIKNKQTHRIAYIKKILIGRVMTHPHSIHIHILHQVDLVYRQLFAAGPSRSWPESMAAYSLKNDLLVIDIDTILRTYLNSTESKL